jgi:hypothetical protein
MGTRIKTDLIPFHPILQYSNTPLLQINMDYDHKRFD